MKCPHCSGAIDMATCVAGGPGPGASTDNPRAGDYSLCGTCGGWLVYTGPDEMRKFGDEDTIGTQDSVLHAMRRGTQLIQRYREGQKSTMMYVEDEDGTVRKAKDAKEWVTHFEKRVPHQTIVRGERPELLVSTVFIGADASHGQLPVPLVYETMIFEGKEPKDRYLAATWEAAMAQHDELVEKLG